MREFGSNSEEHSSFSWGEETSKIGEINESAHFENTAEEHTKNLADVLEEISPRDLNEAKLRIDEIIQDEKTADQEVALYSDMQIALGYLSRIKSLDDKSKVIEELSQREGISEILTNLDTQISSNTTYSKLLKVEGSKYDIGDAVYNLAQAVRNKAEANNFSS